MFIDCKSGEFAPRIGRVEFSQTGRTLYYRGRQLKPMKGYKYNYVDVETGAEYWVSGCKKRGGDTLYGGIIEIDDDAREEYWTTIRNMPGSIDQKTINCPGKKWR